MPAPRLALALACLLVATAPLSGCLANMGDVKAALGASGEEPALPPAPPVAVARVNVTLAAVGSPVLFSSAGSDDPDGLVTSYAWDLGDGSRAAEPVVSHAYARAGTYSVRLTVTDDAGLTATDTVSVTVRAYNAAPTAVLAVTDSRGRPASSGDAGVGLTVSARDSTDPDGDPLTFEWDFGDGATAVGETARHSFERPGVYLVRLTVRDPAGATAVASRLISQNLNLSWHDEEFAPAASKGAEMRFSVPVPDEAARVEVTLRHEAGLGTTSLALSLEDADGRVVAKAHGGGRIGEQGARTKSLTLTPDILREHEGGDWRIVVTLQQGVRVSFDLDARVVA